MDQQFRCQYCKKLIESNWSSNYNKLDRIDPTRSMLIFENKEKTNNVIEMQPINNCLNCLDENNKKLTKYLHDSYHINYLSYKNFKYEIIIGKSFNVEKPIVNHINNSKIDKEIEELQNKYWEEYNQMSIDPNDEYKINPDFQLEWIKCIDNWNLFSELRHWNPVTINWTEINWIISQMVLYIQTKTKINIYIKWRLNYKDSESSIVNTLTEEEYPLYYNNQTSSLISLLITDVSLATFNRGLSNLLDYIWIKYLDKTKNYKRFDSCGIINVKTKKCYRIEYLDDENFLESLIVLRDLLIN